MKKILFTMAALVLVIGLAPLTMAAQDPEPCEPLLVVDLIAGQHMVVGTVTVENDSENLCVTYALNDEALGFGWLIYETHLFISATDDFPLTKANKRLGAPYYSNPRPGLYPYGDEFEEGVPEWTFCISLDELGVEFCEWVYVSAHAVILAEHTEELAVAPYGGSSVVAYDQGLRKNKTPVRIGRSNPDAALTWNTARVETDFFSLGFKFDEDGIALPEGGWIIIEFEHPIVNEEGDDLLVVEDTWGSYPIETAEVYASQDGETWFRLGVADNLDRSSAYNWQTVTYFDLEDVGLAWAKYIKVVDTTPIAAMPDDGDGYDLNVVLALHDHIVTEGFGETAWGDGDRFNQQGNWGMWFMYHVCEPEPVFVETVQVTPFGQDPDLYYPTFSSDLAAGKYLLVASGTYRFANWGGTYGTADALCNRRTAAYASGTDLGDGWYILDSNRLQVCVFGEAVDWRCIDTGLRTLNLDHTYSYAFTHTGGEIEFGIKDTVYGDNSGFITVDIYWLP